MPSHGGVSSPTRRRMNPSTPTKTLRQDAFQDPSPLRDSIEHRRRNNSSDVRTARHEPAVEAVSLEKFLEDDTTTGLRRSYDEGEDPHDLSFSSQHPPRASMVDNMVMSLDQFHHDYNEAATPSGQYTPGRSSRRRGHTLSSSVGSAGDVVDDGTLYSRPKPAVKVSRRNSTSKYQKDLTKLPSIFGEDEDSVRAQVYDNQRAAVVPKPSSKREERTRQKGNKGSAASSIDLGHLAAFTGRLGPAGNRRSRSFDFGSRHRPESRVPDSLDVAALPAVHAIPEAQRSPMSPSFGGPSSARRNSTKSSKSAYGRKSKAGTIGTGTIKGVNDYSVPSMPTFRSAGALNLSLTDHKASLASTDNKDFAKPGFFRRVFGSSRNGPNSDAAEEENSATLPPRLVTSPHRVSTEPSAGKENQPIITKKSSFFRRRKKSVSGHVPPPLPLTLNANLKAHLIPADVPSPVSSLRAFMNPYLGSDLSQAPSAGSGEEPSSGSSHAYHTAQSTPHTSETTFNQKTSAVKDGDNRNRQLTVPKMQAPPVKLGSSLRVPRQDSHLAENDTAEDTRRGSRQETPAPTHDGPKASPTDRSPVDVQKEASHTPTARPAKRSTDCTPRTLEPSTPTVHAPGDQTTSPPATKPEAATKEVVNRADEHLPLPPSILATTTLREPYRRGSEVSEYESAPSTPILTPAAGADERQLHSPAVHVSHPSISEGRNQNDKQQALRLFNNGDDDVDPADASAWLGEAGINREGVRTAYMELFDWTGLTILDALRDLCDRIALRGETQQVDRMLDSFAKRWCQCNSSHGFKSSDVVHTICYSLLLLNTDLHLADIGQKMTRNQFIRNALPTIMRVAEETDAVSSVRTPSPAARTPTPASGAEGRRQSTEQDASGVISPSRPIDTLCREATEDSETPAASTPLVSELLSGSGKSWELQVESVLKSFYTSILRQRLPLFGAPVDAIPYPPSAGGLLSMSGLRRTPSTLSKAQSETQRGRVPPQSQSAAARFMSKARSRPRLASTMGFGSSRTSLDDHSSAWSPSMSSTWSRASLNKTLTSVSVDSFGSSGIKGDYQSSIGFANALSQAIIREDQLETTGDDGVKNVSMLEDESLELCGAPWAKEGIVKHKCHLEGIDKRSKDRNWNDCFAVVEKGWMRLFSFSPNARSLRQKAKNAPKPGGVVGGGNWQDNAEEVWKFMLRHTIASSLPPPGYSKARPYVWALSLPTGAVHLFSVGTPDIVKEFVSSVNYWSARLSKEPMMGGVSNMEYGWSDNVINTALISSESHSGSNRAPLSPRPSTQTSMRSSMDQGSSTFRPKLPGDKAYINDWTPPQQSMMASQLMEVDQLRNLQTYVKNVEEDLQKHNEFRSAMLLAFSQRGPNHNKAMANWEKKSAYLLREIVKFRTYIDILQTGQAQKEKIYTMRREDEESRRQMDDTRALAAAMNA